MGLLLALFFSLPSSAEISVPLTLEPTIFGAGRMSAPCALEGQSFSCVIDTGANTSALHGAYFESLPSKGTSTYQSVGSGTQKCFNIDVHAALGTDAPRTLELVRCPLGVGEDERAILGLDYFGGRRVDFDLNKKTMTLGATGEIPGAQRLAADSLGHAVMAAEMGNKTRVPVQAMWDTGAGLTLVSKSFVRAHPEFFARPASGGDSKDGLGQSLDNELLIMSTLHFGERYFVAEYAMAVDFTSVNQAAGRNLDFIVGYNIIRQANWRLDFARGLWGIE